MTTETEHQTERREDRIQLGKLVEAVDGLKEDIKDLRESWKRDTDKLEKKLDDAGKSFVYRIEFTPVKNVVYGLVAVFCISIITAIIRIVLK